MRPTRQHGTILIVTMWIVLVLAGLVLVLAQSMRVEAVCSANGVSAAQAEAVEQGAIQYVLNSLDGLEGQMPLEADMPCEAVRLGQGAFWIIRPNFTDDRNFSYGVVDEASKLNLNTASLSALSLLPDMTAELAAAIVDWRNSDSTVSSGGAEGEYYLLLSDPYQCKNAPLETVPELFLVKGATPAIVFGEDANRNGILDSNEDDGDAAEPADNRDGRLDRELYPFVTVYGEEPNKASGGQNRINVNNAAVESATSLYTFLQQKLPANRAAAIVGLVHRGRPYRNLFDFYSRCNLTADEFQKIADGLTTVSDEALKGRINVNTAPREVLACLPELGEAEIATLLARRAEGGTDLTSLAWVAQALPPAKALAIGNLVTTQSYQFSADIVSVAGDGRAFKRCRIVVDAQGSPPKVVYRQDLTSLGWPLAPDILARLRTGGSLDDIQRTQTISAPRGLAP